jgi:hypothetical protein
MTLPLIRLSAPICLAVALSGCANVRADNEGSIYKIDNKQILSLHDPERRFASTKFRKVGVLESAEKQFEIYELNFVNPISRHGMQRVAIVEDSRFIGSYQTDGAEISVRENGLRFVDRNLKTDDFMPVESGAFPQEFLINGVVRSLEPNI